VFDLLDAFAFFGLHLVDDAEQAGLDEFDQAFEHLRLAGEVAVKRRFRAVELGGQRGGGDLFPFGFSSISASVCRICSLRSPGFAMSLSLVCDF
jgi:hypothetical protein